MWEMLAEIEKCNEANVIHISFMFVWFSFSPLRGVLWDEKVNEDGKRKSRASVCTWVAHPELYIIVN